MVEAPLNAARLQTLADDEFEVLVDQDIRDLDSEELAAVLRSKEVAPRWHNTLLAIQRRLNEHLEVFNAQVKADMADARLAGDRQLVLEVEAQAERKRASAIRFKAHLRERLREAEQVLQQIGMPVGAERLIDQRNRALARVALLEDVIRQHRKAFPVEGGRSAADTELWSHIDPEVPSSAFNNLDDEGLQATL
jgi:hypothetical protein